MRSVRVFPVCVCILFVTNLAADDNPSYIKGTLSTASHPKSYNLTADKKIYQINHCGDFQDGQEVQFFVKEDKIYIAHPGEKDYKCSIEATIASSDPNSTPTPIEVSAPVYLKGIILGYSTRRDTHVSGTGAGVSSTFRKAKVYELQGPDLVYQVDFCGAFQAGHFAPGQTVEFRVSKGEGRLYIRHDGNKEYGCQLEGTRKPDATENTQSATVPTTAKLQISSVPDGADIEIDGDFAGNTPSDLEVPQGERSIVVKKPGYTNWERKLKVVAGSSIRLNAEMQKSTNP